jgi:hypothetical protein
MVLTVLFQDRLVLVDPAEFRGLRVHKVLVELTGEPAYKDLKDLKDLSEI